MVTMLGVYFFISLVVAAPFLARYVIVSVREHRGVSQARFFGAEGHGLQPLMHHFEQKFLQRF